MIHELAHPANAGVQAGEDRLADQEMTDVELRNLRNGGDGHDVLEGEAVAGVRLDASVRRMRDLMDQARGTIA